MGATGGQAAIGLRHRRPVAAGRAGGSPIASPTAAHGGSRTSPSTATTLAPFSARLPRDTPREQTDSCPSGSHRLRSRRQRLGVPPPSLRRRGARVDVCCRPRNRERRPTASTSSAAPNTQTDETTRWTISFRTTSKPSRDVLHRDGHGIWHTSTNSSSPPEPPPARSETSRTRISSNSSSSSGTSASTVLSSPVTPRGSASSAEMHEK